VRKTDKRRGPREASQPVAKQGFEAGGKGRGRRRWWLLAILGLVFVAYSNSIHGALVFDSSGVVGADPRIREATPQNIESILSGGYWYIVTNAGLYRPIVNLSYLLNYAVFGNGPNPLGYHLVNLGLHEVNVALVYALGILIFGEAAPALALAAIWGLHPVLTESVTNIVGRADLLAAFGVLAGFFCHVKGASAEGRRRVPWLICLTVATTVGLFSKESAAVLPGIMLLYDVTRSERAPWRQKAPGYAAVAVVFAAFLVLRIGSHVGMMEIDPIENPLVSAGFWTARLTAVKVIGKFLWLFLWPARLSADYSFNAVPLFGWRSTRWEDIQALIALAVCLGAVCLAVILAVRGRRAGRPLFFFLVFFFVALSPVSNLIILIGAMMAERFLYLPSVGLAGCVVAAIYALSRSLKWPAFRRVAWAAFGLVCLALAARTYARNFDWEDERSLWSSAVDAYPESARAHYNSGNALVDVPGELPEAISEYHAALRIRPDHVNAHYNLGKALAGIPGRMPEAISEYQAALRLRPDFAEAHNNLGAALSQMPGRLPEAVEEYRAAVRIQPDNIAAHYNLADVLAGIPGRLPEAIAEYREALRLRPNFAGAHNNLGNALSKIPGGGPEAIEEYQAALRIEPNFLEAHLNLGNALAQTPGRRPEAIAEYEAALRIKPDPRIQRVLDRLRSGGGLE
jgi:tetratricopeptide (TPR) repeat protein